ncbi:2-oxo acid dehydrogenase subunit E2 [Nakamurella silvestris]|nr:2-oxo acid dehydrogenase subunit E2 [Nakamurella silvestris]
MSVSTTPHTARLQTFPLPDVGEGLTEADILSWRVAPGDEVTVNQIIVEIETAKAAVELPSPFAGRVHQLVAAVGDTVDVGSPIIVIDTDPGAGPLDDAAGVSAPVAAAPVAAAPVVAAVVAAPSTTDDGVGSKIGEVTADGRIATLVGYINPSGGTTRRPRKGVAPAAPVAPAVVAAPMSVVIPVPASGAAPLATPPVRKLAKELGVDLSTVVATGTGGVISRQDVQTAAQGPVTPAVAGSPDGSRERRVPIKGVRKVTAAAMVASAFTAPHVTEFLAVDVTEMMALRARLKSRPEFASVKLTPLAFVARAVCAAAGRVPDINARWDESAGEIVFPDYVNLGFAASTPRGLMVPNIKDADRMGLLELAAALTELTDTARAGKTSPAAMTGGTFTITNVGVFGVDAGTPILNPGESGILAVGSIKDAPWVVDGQLAVRKVCQLALSFDHRVVDGEQGSRFLADVGASLTDPALAFTW